MARDRSAPLLDPVGLAREDAAAFISVSATFFDSLVKAGLMPKPKVVGARRIWDRRSIEKAFQRLPDLGEEDKADANEPWSGFAA